MAAKYDAIVIGARRSGPSLAAELAGSGIKIAIIERGLFGGTCVNTGCRRKGCSYSQERRRLWSCHQRFY